MGTNPLLVNDSKTDSTIDSELQNHGRVITADFKDFSLFGTYAPCTADQQTPRHAKSLSHRTRWESLMDAHLRAVKDRNECFGS